MHHLHVLANQVHEERIREAERRIRSLAEGGMLASGELAVIAGTSSHRLRHTLGLLRQLRRPPVVRRL